MKEKNAEDNKPPMVNIFSSSRYKINRKKIKQEIVKILSRLDLFKGKGYGINIVFVGRNKMKQIGQKFKNKNQAFPVLSFSYLKSNQTRPMTSRPKIEDNLIGEIVICYPQAVLLAAERDKRVDDTILYLIEHGISNIINDK